MCYIKLFFYAKIKTNQKSSIQVSKTFHFSTKTRGLDYLIFFHLNPKKLHQIPKMFFDFHNSFILNKSYIYTEVKKNSPE